MVGSPGTIVAEGFLPEPPVIPSFARNSPQAKTLRRSAHLQVGDGAPAVKGPEGAR
jgi:hypothetical protein